MPGRFPVTPVYDLKLKGADLVVGTHGRSFWIMDDITPLRALSHGQHGTRLFAPRETVRTKLHFAALRGARAGTSTALAFGIGGGIITTEQPDGRKHREHLDVGENPPQGVIVYYWLAPGADGPVTLAFRDGAGTEIIGFRSDDETLGIAKRPTTMPGLNRFVWDLKYPGPAPIDKELAAKTGALAADGDNPSGPVAVPGDYEVALAAADETQTQRFTIVPDPRLATTPEGYAAQFALLQDLTAALSRLHDAVNRVRRLKRGLARVPEAFTEQAARAKQALEAIEGVLVDIFRMSPRDVLRHPAGLNDTLADLLAGVGISDTPPTASHAAVSRDLIARADAEIGKVDAIVSGDIAEINRAVADAGVTFISD